MTNPKKLEASGDIVLKMPQNIKTIPLFETVKQTDKNRWRKRQAISQLGDTEWKDGDWRSIQTDTEVVLFLLKILA